MSEQPQAQVDPQEEQRRRLAELLRSIQDSANQHLTSLSFAAEVEQYNQRQAQLRTLQAEAHRLRARGYRFRGDVEHGLRRAEALLPQIGPALRAEADRADRTLRQRAEALARDARALVAQGGDPLWQQSAITALDGERRGVEEALAAARRRVTSHLDPLGQLLDGAQGTLKDLHWTLDQFEGASFRLGPGESAYACAQATWQDAPGGQPRPGLLLFSDLRVRFEHRETVVTKRKLLFFAAETQTIQELLLDEPYGHLKDSQDSTRGWIAKDHFLTFSFGGPSRATQQATFELTGGYSKQWDELVEKLRAGAVEPYDAGPGQARLGTPVRWPERCDGCHAPLGAPVQGQAVLPCTYCGAQHRVELS